MRTTLLLSPLLAIAACQPKSGHGLRESPGAAAPTQAALRVDIDRVRGAWAEAAERDDAAGLAELYADDGLVIDPLDYVPVQGRAAIRKVLAAELPVVGQLKLRSQDVHASGDLAYDYGEFTEQVTQPGKQPTTIGGHYLLILRRQEDGAWKIVKKIAMMSPVPLTQSTAE